MSNLFQRFLKNESGATAIEYALITAIIGIGLVVALGNLRTDITEAFDRVGDGLDAAAPAAASGS